MRCGYMDSGYFRWLRIAPLRLCVKFLASSPLVVQGVVVVFAGARDGKPVVAYQEDSGKLAWTASVGPKPG